jgi:hypothetical protein
VDKYARYRKKNMDRGLCPCCGKQPHPGFKQCLMRIKLKKLNRILNQAVREGIFSKPSRGLFVLPADAKE